MRGFAFDGGGIPKIELIDQNGGNGVSSLESFRRHVAGSHLDAAHSPYTLNKSRAHTYKILFCTIGAILLLLGLTVFTRSTNSIFEIHIGYYWLIKLFVGSFSFLIGTLSLTLGFRLKNEEEVAFSLYLDARRKLTRLYHCKLTSFGGTRLYFIPANPERARPLKRAHLEALEQIRDQQDSNALLMKQIAKAPFLPMEERENLFNRALSELRQAHDAVVRSFSLAEFGDVQPENKEPAVPSAL